MEDNKPKFVIMDYGNYQKTLTVGKSARVAPNEAVVVASKRILITGGAGYIGSHTGRLLRERGFDITTYDNLTTGKREFAQGKFVEADLADTEALDRVFAEGNFEAVVHFAASIEVGESVSDPAKYYRNNVVNGYNLLNAMVRHNVRNLVFSSTCAVYDDNAPVPVNENSPLGPASPYAETKLVFENMLKSFGAAYGLNGVVLRYFNAAGASFDQSLGLINPNPSHLIPSAINVALGKKDVLKVYGNDYHTQDGTGIRDYIHVLDLAEAHFLSLNYLFSGNEQGNHVMEAFNVGSERGYSVLEIINAVCEYTGHMVKFEIAPRRAGDREKVVADNGKIRRVLGFEPQFSDLRTIVETAWAWQKKNS